MIILKFFSFVLQIQIDPVALFPSIRRADAIAPVDRGIAYLLRWRVFLVIPP